MTGADNLAADPPGRVAESAVEQTRSQKITVSCRRSRRGSIAQPRGAGWPRRASENIGALGCSTVGVAEERRGDADMRRIADGQLGLDGFSEEMRVQGAAELTLGEGAHTEGNTLGGKRSSAIADPKGVAGDRCRRPPRQLRSVLGYVSFNVMGEGPPGEASRRTARSCLAPVESNPPLIAAALQGGADGHGNDIARSQGASRQGANQQPSRNNKAL